MCNVDTVDYFNNMKIYPRLQSILQKDYFRYFNYNAKKPCPFWNNTNDICQFKSCGVQACTPEEIPSGLKSETKSCDNDKMTEVEHNNQVDATISDQTLADLQSWKAFDASQSQFCELDPEDNCPDCDYVDLSRNPERFTGYSGEASHRIWKAIYEENCFRPSSIKSTHFSSAFLPDMLEGMCLEKRVFYRAISGLHASITVHLTSQHPEGAEDSKSNHLFPGIAQTLDLVLVKFIYHIFSGLPNSQVYGPNINLFHERFDPERTNGMGPYWLKNLYFVYLLELRALTKAAPILEAQKFYTGNEEEDIETQIAVKELLNLIKSFPDQFDETVMFKSGKSKEMLALKEDFKLHFKNITKIMDCVGCEKCKLWGKLQATGLGTALKILFSSNDDKDDILASIVNVDLHSFTSKVKLNSSDSTAATSNILKLSRNEIVALFNAFGKISTSIQQLERFRRMKT